MKTQLKKKGALFFTVDTMVAGLAFAMTVIIVLSLYIQEPETQSTYDFLNEYTSYISNTKMDKFKNVYRYIYDDPSEPDTDFFVYQKIAKLYNTGNSEVASDFINNFTKVLVPLRFGVMYKLDDTVIYERTNGMEEFTNTNLSTQLLVFYFDNETIAGPYVTTITIWS